MRRERKRKVIAAGVFGLLSPGKKKIKIRKGQKVKNIKKKPKNQ